MDIGFREIVLVLLGFVLAWAPPWFDRRRRIKSHWAALRAEILICVERAQVLQSENVMAPLYRLPTTAFEKAFPLLLVEGEMTEHQLRALTLFFSHAQDINRGLDHATAMAHADDDLKLRREYSRVVGKAAELVVGSNGKDALSVDAFELVNKKLGVLRKR